jgi:uncharacterized protein YndB with AHSA1/START domain
MSTPNVPLRLSFEIEVSGTPEQVWAAIATAAGQSAWFMPTDSDERAGGRQVIHMGDDDAPADITAWEPPRRLAFEEDLTQLVQRPDATISPLTTELLVEARSGGTCVVRVVSSAFGVGADWEQEFFESMESGWVPFFTQLRLYLAHFPGQRATTFDIVRMVSGSGEEILAAARRELGVEAVGERFALGDASGVAEDLDGVVLVRLEAPVPGMVRLFTGGPGGAEAAQVFGYLFPAGAGDDEALVEQVRRTWSAFLDEVVGQATEVRR